MTHVQDAPVVPPTDPAGPSRRTVLVGCAVACGTVGLSACSVNDDLRPEGSVVAESQEPVEAGGVITTDLQPGESFPFHVGDEPAVLVRLPDGAYVAFSAVCTHQGCTVTYRDEYLRCPCHGSVFDPSNEAEPVEGPAQVPLREVAIQETDEGIVLA